MENPKYRALFDYLTHISRHYQLQICILDYQGVTTRDHEFSNMLHPFLLHRNPYCLYIKQSNKRLFDQCLCRKDVAEKCAKVKQPFYGMCYAGVEEFVVPIFHQDELVLTIFAGAFRTRQKTALYRMKKIAKAYNLSYETLLEHYYSSLSPEAVQPELINSLLSIAAQYLRYIYTDAISELPLDSVKMKKNTNSDHILIHALEFIHNNYCEQIFVSQISEHCHCSESYINHMFKNKMGVTLNNYMNQLRIDRAKKYLVESDAPIKEIAMNVGFNDPNYFSKVFSDLSGCSPTQFRNKA